jgi:hypothetical protein
MSKLFTESECLAIVSAASERLACDLPTVHSHVQSLAVPSVPALGDCASIGGQSLNAQFIDDLRYMAESALDPDSRALFLFQLRTMAEFLIGYRAA